MIMDESVTQFAQCINILWSRLSACIQLYHTAGRHNYVKAKEGCKRVVNLIYFIYNDMTGKHICPTYNLHS